MSSSLRPYRYWEEDGKYVFLAPSGARYVAYFLDLSYLAANLFTFNFDKERDGTEASPDDRVFDTVCSILGAFFSNHRNSMLVVCDSSDGRAEARSRLFNSWFKAVAPPGLIKIDKNGKTDTYDFYLSGFLWDDNPDKKNLITVLDDYFTASMTTD